MGGPTFLTGDWLAQMERLVSTQRFHSLDQKDSAQWALIDALTLATLWHKSQI